MKIHLDIEADSPADLESAIRGLAGAFGAVTSVSADVVEPTRHMTATEAAATADEVKPEPAKRGRKPKAVEPEPEVEPTAEPDPEPEVDGAKEEPAPETTKPITPEEVREAIIDMIGGWATLFPNNPDFRKTKLQHYVLGKFGVQKIKELFEADPPNKLEDILAAVQIGNDELAQAQRDAASEE